MSDRSCRFSHFENTPSIYKTASLPAFRLLIGTNSETITAHTATTFELFACLLHLRVAGFPSSVIFFFAPFVGYLSGTCGARICISLMLML